MNIEELRAFKSQIEAIARANKAGNIRVFGSVARGEATSTSDIDFLVTLNAEASLFDIAGLHADLNDLLPCKVDVVADESIDPRIAPYIEKDIIPL